MSYWAVAARPPPLRHAGEMGYRIIIVASGAKRASRRT